MEQSPSQFPEAPPRQGPPATGSSDDRLWIILCHVSVLLSIGLILPLIVYAVKKGDNPEVAEHARETLNFHLTYYLYGLACLPLIFVFIGIPLLLLLALAIIILSLVGTFKAADGILYRYPLTLRLI